MAWSVVQSAVRPVSPAGTTVTKSYSGNLQSGNKMIAVVYRNATGQPSSVTDANSNNFTQIIHQNLGSGGVQNASVWVLDVPAADVGTAQTITATGTSTTWQMWLAEVSGLAAGSGMDGAGSTNSGTTGTSFSEAGFTTTSAGDLLLAVVTWNSTASFSVVQPASPAYTMDANVNNPSTNNGLCVATRTSAAAHFEAPTWTKNTGTNPNGWTTMVFALPLPTPFQAESVIHTQAVNRAAFF